MATAGRAATTECGGCHYIFPKPEMRQLHQTVGGEWVPSRRINRHSASGRLTGYSETPGYARKGRRVSTWYCSTCYPKFARIKFFKNIGTGVAGIGVLAFLAFGSHTNNRSHPVSSDNSQPEVVSALPVEAAEDRTAEQRASSVEATETEQASDSIPAMQLPIAVESSAVEVTRGSPVTPETSSELRESISKAVETGKAQRWRSAGSSGFVAVSEAEPQTGCRAVYYTIENVKPALKSQTRTVCPGQDSPQD